MSSEYDNNKAVVLLSGGIDSATCLAMASRSFKTIQPVHYNYGQQTADFEQKMAEKQARHLNEEYDDVEILPVKVIDYRSVFGEFAEGVAKDGKDFDDLEEEDGRSSGYVPMRNLHLIASGAAVADMEGAVAVYHGAQMGDEADYPDCRPDFMDSAAGAIKKSVPEERPMNLYCPLIGMDKPMVIAAAEDFGVDLSLTYSCYSEIDDPTDPEPCGECPACVERAEAFRKAGVADPFGTEVTLQ
jgi:7-cyano-7-deazaguanine synthase